MEAQYSVETLLETREYLLRVCYLIQDQLHERDLSFSAGGRYLRDFWEICYEKGQDPSTSPDQRSWYFRQIAHNTSGPANERKMTLTELWWDDGGQEIMSTLLWENERMISERIKLMESDLDRLKKSLELPSWEDSL